MKHIIYTIATFTKVTATIVGILAGLFVLTSLVSFVAYETGFGKSNTPRMEKVKANCTARGGKWVVNPNSLIPHAIYGEGCDLDYEKAKS